MAGSLPKALERLGVEIDVVVPKYGEIKNTQLEKRREITIEFAQALEKVIVWQTELPNSNVKVILLENEHYLSTGEHQAFAGTVSEIERFAFFSKAIVGLITHHPQLITPPDLLHLNDWHVSLVPLLSEEACRLPSLLTIHNISYQGQAPLDLLQKLDLKTTSCRVLSWDAQNRDIDILMEGIIHADFVNTVSPTYAREIKTPEFGFGIEEVLKGKEGRVVGILNGLDYEVWNPETDKNINFQYSSSDFQLGKTKNKLFLQKQLGLEVKENMPLLAFIGRLEPKQKGLDILYEAMEQLLPEKSFQFVLLGTGNKEWEERFNNETMKQFSNFVFMARFDEKLAHQIYAGADIILVPSRFEPCGLPQMIAMRYGALPLVRKTGGLADSVRDSVNGFVFEEYSGEALTNKIKEAIEKVKNQKPKIKMTKEAMQQDFSWDKSARDYLQLYKLILKINEN